MNGGDDDEVIIKYFYNLNYDDSRNEWFWWWWRDLMNDFDDDCQDCHSLNEWFWWWWQDDLDYNDRGEVRCWWGGGGGEVTVIQLLKELFWEVWPDVGGGGLLEVTRYKYHRFCLKYTVRKGWFFVKFHDYVSNDATDQK